MSVGFYVSAGVFAAVAIAHLIFAWLELDVPRGVSKILLMPLLLLTLILGGLKNGWVIAGLALSALGDALLIKPSNKILFYSGSGAFALAHIAYLIALFVGLNFSVSPLVYAIIGFVVLIFVLVCAIFIFPRFSEEHAIPVSIYAGLLLVCIAFSLSYLIQEGSLSAVLLLIGALLFSASDIVLAYKLFVERLPRHSFYVMLLYIAAQVCIGFGFLIGLGI